MRSIFHSLLSLSLLVVVGCGEETSDGDPTATATAEHEATATPEAELLDLRFDIPEAPEVGFQWVSGEMEIPPGTEMQWCFFDTYTGPDVGVNHVISHQTQQGGHHAIVLLTAADEDEFPDGTAFDCTDRETLPMTEALPFYIGAEAGTNDLLGTITGAMTLPEGMASSLKSGSRIVLQSHFVNYNSKPILVRDVVNISTIPVEEVEVWAAPWVISDQSFELQPNSSESLTMSCEWTQETELLFLLGHMHEHGTSINIQHEIPEEEDYSLYAIEQWLPEYRDVAPVDVYESGEMLLNPGEKFVVNCNWFNDSDATVVFPSEMCVATGMAFPSKVTIFPKCD